MTGGTINDITKLRFYSDKGYEIPMQKEYILTWEIIPQGDNAIYVLKNPSGYFIGDVDFSNPANIKIAPNSLQVGFIENGEVFARFADFQSSDTNNKTIFSYKNTPTNLERYLYIHDILLNNENLIKISINVNGTEYSATYQLSFIFNIHTSLSLQNYDNTVTYKKICVGNNLNGENEYYELIGLNTISLIYDNGIPYIQKIFESKVPNIGLYFPFIRYSGSLEQNTVSSGFIAANTIIILEESSNANDEPVFEKPYISSANQYSLVFLPASNSEIKLISPNSLYNIEYVNERAFYLADQETTSSITPLTFAIAFQAEVEGVYLNFLGIYMRSVINPNIVFFMGCLVIKTLVEGEDERFRTLLGNFGVVDPIKYPNLFAEQDYQEQGKDFTIINKKSKELMLTYDQIFSYVGTYKALLGAIKFLGYNDIIFKEWYTLKDTNDKETDIAVLVFDTETGSFLKQKLADFGVSIEDFKSYNKINKLTMIYHLNEIDDDNYEYIDQHLVHYKKATYDSQGDIIDSSSMVVLNKYTKLSEVPLTRPIYEYRNEETLAKLFGVKKWLEANVIGVNAYISDISGEGVYFGWHKTLAYSTQHYLTDYSQEQYYTADVKSVKTFKNSESAIRCTLTELNNGIKFCEYEHTTFEAFDKIDASINMTSASGVQLDISTMTISNTIESPVLGDEYEFEVSVKPEYGTLYEWTVDGSSLILFNEGELNLLFEEYDEAEIDSSCLPIITLENANIHKCYGNWQQNIEWSVKETIDQDTGNVNYKLKNYGAYRSDSYAVYNNNYINLVPSHPSASIKYTENNKYRVPLLIIKGYEFDTLTNDISSNKLDQYTLGQDNEYVLEIMKGDILFKRIDNVGALVTFVNDLDYINTINNNYSTNTYELEISIKYTYSSDKKPFTIINYKNIQDTIDTSVFDYSVDVSILKNNVNTIYSYYDEFLSDRKKYISDQNNNVNNVALLDASSYLDSTIFIQSLNEFINKKAEALEKECLYNDFINIYNDNYIFNQYIDTSVTRLGTYDVLCKAYDKYNNVFVNKYAKTASVTAKPIAIDIYSAQQNSENSSTFYRYNENGTYCDSSMIQEIMDNSDTLPLFPKQYHIYDFDYKADTNTIEFDNISYAIDTPKNNDYLVLDNMTELCTGAEIIQIDSSISTKLNMLDENPHKVYLYNPSTAIKINIYDKILLCDYVTVGPLNIIDSSCQDTLSDISAQDDSYIIVDSSIDQDIIDCINNKSRYATYILNVTEHVVDTLYYVDYVNNTTSIMFPSYYNEEGSYKIFNEDDVVKIRYYLINNVNGYDSSIINETTYRIIDISEETIVDASSNEYILHSYTINGIINEDTIDSSNYKVVMSLASNNAVHYVTRVVDNAYEYNYPTSNNNYIIRDKFKYASGPMMLNYYIDDTFGGTIYDYDSENIKKIWFDPNTVFDASNMDLYVYHDTPITVPQGRQLVFHSHDNDGTFVPNYHVQWKVSNYVFDDIANWENHKNNAFSETTFRSINDYLCIKPEFLGSTNVELECIDKYGNRLVNEGSGILYVADNPNYTSVYNSNGIPTYVDPSTYSKYTGMVGF